MEKDNKQRFNPGDHVALTNLNCEIEHLIVPKVTVLDDRVMYWTNDGYWFGNHEYAVKEDI